MKSWIVLTAAASIMFLSSAAHTEPTAATPGSEAPALEVSNGQGAVSIASMRGHYVILNFWNSADPQSRIDNALYDRSFARSSSGVKCISICTDDDRYLFEQIIRVDGLQEASQYFHDDSRLGSLMADYSAVGAGKTFLIGPDGHVIALDPDVKTIETIVGGDAA